MNASLHPEEGSLCCVTGRFQPVHEQHLELFERALDEHEHLIIAITNPDSGAWHYDATSVHRHTAAANPFTYFERARLLEAALIDRGISSRTTLVPFDLSRPQFWNQYVPLHAHHYVRAYGDWERQKARQLQRAGYKVSLLEGDLSGKLSSSSIRAALRKNGNHWHTLVPRATIPLLEGFVRQGALKEYA